MNICIGNWESTAEWFKPEVGSDDEIEREAEAQSKKRLDDLCVGVYSVEDFERAYNSDKDGYYTLDPAFYWIRFTKGQRK